MLPQAETERAGVIIWKVLERQVRKCCVILLHFFKCIHNLKIYHSISNCNITHRCMLCILFESRSLRKNTFLAFFWRAYCSHYLLQLLERKTQKHISSRYYRSPYIVVYFSIFIKQRPNYVKLLKWSKFCPLRSTLKKLHLIRQWILTYRFSSDLNPTQSYL